MERGFRDETHLIPINERKVKLKQKSYQKSRSGKKSRKIREKEKLTNSLSNGRSLTETKL